MLVPAPRLIRTTRREGRRSGPFEQAEGATSGSAAEMMQRSAARRPEVEPLVLRPLGTAERMWS